MDARPFALWRLSAPDSDEPSETRPDLPPELRWRDSLYRAMGAVGWAPHEVDLMDAWTVASFLGHGPEGDEADYRPVFRGSRQIVHRDETDDTPDKSAEQHVLSVSGDERRAAYATARQPDG